jgi:zinc transporter ZupT
MNYLSLFIEFLVRFLAGSVIVIGLGVLLEKIFKMKEKTPKAVKGWIIFVMGVVAGISVGQKIIENIEVGKEIRIAWEI